MAQVLNRPSAVSMCGTLPPGSARAVRGARHVDPEAVRAERFAGAWPPDAAGGGAAGAAGAAAAAGELEVYDYATSRSSYGPASASAGPFRYRAAGGPARLVKIRAIGDRAMATTDVTPATLDASRRVAARYQLDLATVWWLIGTDDGSRTLARVDGWEWDAGGDVTDVAGADSGLDGRTARRASGG